MNRRLTSVARRGMLTGAVLAAAFALPGCTGERKATGGPGGGTLVISTAADADFLFPPLLMTTLARQVSDQLFESLADVGDSLNVIGDAGFVPRLADSWSWAPDSLSIAFHMNPRARWHDGKAVRAADVRFTYGLYSDSAVAGHDAALLANIDSVSVKDSLTPIVWFKRRSPEQFYDAAAEMAILPEHVYSAVPAASLGSSELLRHPVGSGPFRFSKWLPGSEIEIVSNPSHYRAPAKLGRVIWSIAADPAAAATRFMSGEADLFEAIRPEMLPAIQQSTAVHVVTFPGFKYGFLGFNLRNPKRPGSPNPMFGDRGLRRALTMAVDRSSLVRNVFDTLATTSIGPTVRAMPTTDMSVQQIPYDPAAANRALDSLGWRVRAGDSVRVKNGVPLSFSILTPSSSKDRARLAVLLQDQFKRVGAKVDIHSVEINAVMQQLNSHDFDAAMATWGMVASPGAVRATWSSTAANAKGAANYTGYASPIFDREVDSALTATSLSRARPLFAHAYQTIVDDAPAIWLYEPKNLLGVHRRIHLAPLRADAWWMHLSEWYVAPSDQIARDRSPAGSSTHPAGGSN